MPRTHWALWCCLAASSCYSGRWADSAQGVDTDADGQGVSDGTGGSDEGGTADDPSPVDGDAEATRLWRLSASQYERTVEVALGVEVHLPRIAVTSRMEDFVNYAEGSGVDSVFFAKLEEDLFTLATENLDTIAAQLPCAIDSLDEACLTEFLGPFVRQAHRTDTTPLEPYVALYAGLAPGQGNRDAFASVLVAVLLSPKAFFRTELGADDAEAGVELTSFELAENLAYTVWNGPPDDELFAAAQDGSIRDPEVFAEQLDRMLESPDGNRGMVEFLSQWLGLAGLLSLEKDPIAFPEFDPDLRASMLQETLDLFEYVLDQEGADFRTLLTTQKSFADDRLAGLYGVAPSPVSGGMIDLPPSERRGVFTHPSVIVAMSDAAGTAAMYRGKALLNRVICSALPPRPAGVEPTPPPGIPEDATTRQKFETLEDTAPCNSCHISMHPFSFAMEQYDPIGRFRDTQNDKPIDPSGQLSVASSPDPITFADMRELVDDLAERPEVYDCLVTQGIRYTFGRTESELDDESFMKMSAAFRETRNIRELFRELVITAAFRNRMKVEENECFSP